MITRKDLRDTPQYGSIHAHAVSSQITSVAQYDWDQVVSFDTNGRSWGQVVPDYTNNHITIGISGDYQVHFSWSGYGPAVAHDWILQIAKNNRSGQYESITSHFTTPTTQKNTTFECSDIINLTAGDTIELWVQRESAGSDIILTTVHSVIDLHMVGP